jgi:hypothetical protein
VDLVLHNGMYDLLFLYSHFEARLPDSLVEFKARISTIFPRVFDTKVFTPAFSTQIGFCARESRLIMALASG